jgi:hypothetical protein
VWTFDSRVKLVKADEFHHYSRMTWQPTARERATTAFREPFQPGGEKDQTAPAILSACGGRSLATDAMLAGIERFHMIYNLTPVGA